MLKMKNNKLVYTLLIVIIFASCSIFKKSPKVKISMQDRKQTENVDTLLTKKTTDNPTRIISVPTIENQIKKSPYKTCLFKCKTSFKGMPINISVRTTYDSLFWFSALSMGIEVFRAKCNKDSIYLLDKFNREYIQWSYAKASMIVGLPLSFDFVQELFTDSILVKSYNTAKFNGTIVKKLQKVNNISLPILININGKLNNKDQHINIIIKDHNLNPKNSYPFDIPKGFKRN